MIAQWRLGATDRMRLIDRPEVALLNIMREIEKIRSVLTSALQKADAHPIKDVHLVIGELSDLTETTNRQHWLELGKGTLAERATLHFRLITAEVQCMVCFQKYHPLEKKIHCPFCGSFGAKILVGEEFHLETIQLGSE